MIIFSIQCGALPSSLLTENTRVKKEQTIILSLAIALLDFRLLFVCKSVHCRHATTLLYTLTIPLCSLKAE